MSWPEERKQKTHARIVEAAAAAFRQRGVAAVGVAEVMRRAGLTHGGFYAHFSSKDELLAEALTYASSQANEMLQTPPPAAGEQNHPLLATASAFLSPSHLAHPEVGCPVAALGPEIIRGERKVLRALAAAIRTRLKGLANLLSGGLPPETGRQQATGAYACMIGGMILARSLKGAEALEVLNDCQAFLRDALLDPAAGGASPKPHPATASGR